ncbi:MAG: hypothetical protein CSA52_03025 [Gammaproteobacteria bacterium]|nr:MAG: hypothetical protein CSB48_03760 [Pseudomonadota bacterium]PIE38170.1 MAG: hypothetical protein CSA52_03025 [Gammaproteobacteria bacterium]
MASPHELNTDLQNLTDLYHCGDLKMTDYRAKRRQVLDGLIDTRSPGKPAPAVTAQRKTVKIARYVGISLIVASLLALAAIFNFRFPV